MTEKFKKIFSHESVQYHTKSGSYRFVLKDRGGRSHAFSTNPKTFEEIVHQFRTCLSVAKTHLGHTTPATDPLSPPDGDIAFIDVTGFDLGVSADNMLALQIRSASNPAIELRFPPEALTTLQQALVDAGGIFPKKSH